MEPMHLPEVERFRPADGPIAPILQFHDQAGIPAPQIMHLFAWKPNSKYLALWTQEVMRGPSELSPGQRELIAAVTSGKNQCLF